MTTAENDIDTLQTNVTNLTSRVTTAEGKIDENTTNISVNETAINNIVNGTTRLSYLRATNTNGNTASSDISMNDSYLITNFPNNYSLSRNTVTSVNAVTRLFPSTNINSSTQSATGECFYFSSFGPIVSVSGVTLYAPSRTITIRNTSFGNKFVPYLTYAGKIPPTSDTQTRSIICPASLDATSATCVRITYHFTSNMNLVLLVEYVQALTDFPAATTTSDVPFSATFVIDMSLFPDA